MQRTVSGRAMGRSGNGASSLGGRQEKLNLFCEMHKNLASPPVPPVTAISSVDSKVEDDLLTSDVGKNDYDWLLTPPGTPFFNGMRQATRTMPMDSVALSQNDLPNLMRSLAAIKTSRASDAMSRRLDTTSKVQGNNLHSINGTQSKRSSLVPKSMPTSRCTTPSGRATISSPFASTKASSSTPRLIASSRPSTPSRRPSVPVSSQPDSQSLGNTSRRSSISRVNSTASVGTTSSRGSSPVIKPRAVPTPIIPGFSLEPPPNLRTMGPTHSSLNSRGRPGMPTSRGTASIPATPVRGVSRAVAPVETGPDRLRRPSSPGFARASSTMERVASNSTTPMLSNGKVEFIPSQPFARGSKPEEKMMVSRRNSTPMSSPSSYFHDQSPVSRHTASRPITPSKKDAPIYWRDPLSVSKKSLDMTLKQMDLRQSSSNGLRSLISNINASSLHRVKSMNGQNLLRQCSATMDPVGSMPEGSELGEEIIIDTESKASSIGNSDMSYTFSKDISINSWIGSPEYRDNAAESLELFYQSMEKPVVNKSAATCPHGGAGNCDLCSLKQRLWSLNQACKKRSILNSTEG